MAMTEEERRKARNEASRRCREAKKAAAGKAAKNPATKKERKSVKGPDSSTVDKFVKKNVKTVEAFKKTVKDAAETLAAVYATCDENLITGTHEVFGKRLSLDVVRREDGDGADLKVSIGAKVFPPKTPIGEVLTDPALLAGVESGDVTETDLEKQDDDDGEYDEEDRPSWADKDLDEMTDEEREEYDAAQEDEIDEDYVSGRGDMMREMEEQGGFDFED